MESIKLSRLNEICKNVSADSSELAKYAKSKFHGKGLTPDAVVKPESIPEVVALVKWARETKTPLVTVSSTGDHYNGGSNPSVPGAVIVDMSNMKRVISVNRQFRMTVAEPGVTYGEIQKELAKDGMYLMTTLAPKAGKSVVASVVDCEPRITPNYSFNYVEPLRTCRTVWGDGNEMGTGDANGPADPTIAQKGNDKWQINYRGPGLIDYYRLLTESEGTMGIVTWASMHCNLIPKYHEMYFVPSDSLDKVVEFVYQITRIRFGEEIFILSGSQFANLMGKDAADIAIIQSKAPAWIALVGIASSEVLPEMRFAQQKKDIANIAQSCGLDFLPCVAGVLGKDALAKATSPCEGTYWKEMRKGAFKDIFFIATMDKAQKMLDVINKVAAEEGFAASEIGTYIQPVHQGVTSSICFTISYDPANAEEAAKAAKVFDRASTELCNAGAYFSRPYGKWARLQLNKNAQGLDMLKKVKKIFDPDNILNPGKISDF